MSRQEQFVASTSRAVAARNAGQYLRELLRSEPRYRQRWMRYRHDRERDVHQMSVARVLAAELRRNPRRDDDASVTHEQLVHIVSRALKPKGTVLARETLALFVRAFEITDEHAAVLWRQWGGDELARVVNGQLPPPDAVGSAAPLYETIALREYHYIGPDGQPTAHRSARDIRSLTDDLTQYRYTFDTSEVTVERISGGQPGEPRRRYKSLWSVDITLPRTLNHGDEHSLEFETKFHYAHPVEPCLRRAAHERFENVVLRVEFHPGKLPQKVYWAEWLDYREPKVVVIQEELVDLDAENAVYHRLDVLNRAVVGFRWEF